MFVGGLFLGVILGVEKVIRAFFIRISVRIARLFADLVGFSFHEVTKVVYRACKIRKGWRRSYRSVVRVFEAVS